MSKITNDKEKYRSRSTIASCRQRASQNRPAQQKSRSKFTVDQKGYFVWNSTVS